MAPYEYENEYAVGDCRGVDRRRRGGVGGRRGRGAGAAGRAGAGSVRRTPPRWRRHGSPDGDEGDLPYNTDRLFVPRWRLTDGPHVRAAFREVVDDAAAATVVILCDGKRRGLGGVLSADGWILTKATPLCGTVSVEFPDGRKLEGTTVGENGEYDLALVKVNGQGFTALNLDDATVPEVGSWLATVGLGRDPVAVGVVSVGPREIPPQPGYLGVVLDQTDANRPVVEEVLEGSGAATAGIEVGDRITSVDGVATPTRDELIDRVRTFNPDDEITLKIVRDGERSPCGRRSTGTFPGLRGAERVSEQPRRTAQRPAVRLPRRPPARHGPVAR